MADLQLTTESLPPQPLDPADIVREMSAVALECKANILPFARSRRRSRSRAERKHVEQVRQAVYRRSGGLCELQLSPKCWGKAPWESGHLCHELHRSRGGEWSPENCRWGCPECHTGWQHNGGKPCPAKI